MHADDLDVDAGLVRRLLAAQFPRWAELDLEPIESSGTVNYIYRLGDDMAVRLPRRAESGSADGLEHEFEWMPRLAPHLPVATPEPLAKGAPGDGYPWPWSVSRWLEGENPTPGEVDDPERLARDLAELVAALRRIDPNGAPPGYRGGPLEEVDAAFRSALADSHALVETDAVLAVWESALRQPRWAGPPVWIHCDLLPGNLLVSEGRLSGVLDFAASGVGDPACDLMVAWALLPAGARGLFRGSLGVDDVAWARGRGWALAQSLIALPYYLETNPVMAANARHAIGEILAEG